MKIIVPLVPYSPNVLRRRFRTPMAYKKMRDEWKRSIWYMVDAPVRGHLAAMAASGERLSVKIHVQHKKLFDQDNLYGSVKPVLDSLVELGFLKDDNSEHIEMEVTQEKSIVSLTYISIERIVK